MTNALQSAIQRQRTRPKENQMLKLAKLAIAIAVAGFAMPALSQSKDGFAYAGAEESGAEIQQYRYFTNEEKESHPAWRQLAPATKTPASPPTSGFTYRGDEGGWEPAPHKYVLIEGRFAMSDECDHAIRLVQAPSREDIDAVRNLSPGA